VTAVGGRRARASSGLIVWLTLLSACGGSGNPGGPGPITPAPTISCPASLQVGASQPTPVPFPPPTTQNGQPPVVVSCLPASGSVFAPGSTPVTCTATDAQSRAASCTFTVTVAGVPTLAVTKFLAFGDSLTEGTTSPDVLSLVVNKPESYPSQLQELLQARYTDQTIAVVNEGCGGEFTTGRSTHCAGGVARLPEVLARERPEVLLLMHGANDLRTSRQITTIVGALETMVGQAQQAGVTVMVASLPPQNPDGSRGNAAPRLPEFAREIQRMAADEGALFVDLYNVLGTWQGLVGVDGLHPTPAGYQKIAGVWGEEIQKHFEAAAQASPTPAPTSLLTRISSGRRP
jgi:lysophospholipase L1-like esterase